MRPEMKKQTNSISIQENEKQENEKQTHISVVYNGKL